MVLKHNNSPVVLYLKHSVQYKYYMYIANGREINSRFLSELNQSLHFLNIPCLFYTCIIQIVRRCFSAFHFNTLEPRQLEHGDNEDDKVFLSFLVLSI